MDLRRFIIKTLSTFFYVGYLPLIPGTFGSLAGILIYYLVKDSSLTYMMATIILVFSGLLVCGPAEQVFAKKDPKYVVIDEVLGMLISLLFIPYQLRFVVMGFILFRMFDTIKPYPVRRIEELRGAWGIMGDDIVAGIYTNIVLQIVVRFASCRTS